MIEKNKFFAENDFYLNILMESPLDHSPKKSLKTFKMDWNY